MKKFILSSVAFFIIWLILIAASCFQEKRSPQFVAGNNTNAGFAVLELFTSQGCSSCPPADELLGNYAVEDNDHIMALAFHVDYWNRLGWTDSFSSAGFSERQREYTLHIRNSSVYTPQLVINGEKEFVGSDAGKINLALTDAIKEKPVLFISIDEVKEKEGTILINYSFDKPIRNTTVRAALVQKKVVTNILSGENRGVKLVNYNVVRDFQSSAVRDNRSFFNLHMPVGSGYKDFVIVLYVQEDASGKIIGAMKKDL